MKHVLQASLLAGLLAATLSVAADSHSHRAKAETLLDKLNARSMVEQLRPQVEQVQTQIVLQLGVPDDKAELRESFETELSALMDDALSWERLRGDMATLYVERFEEDELQTILDFYDSPAGQKMLRETPAISRQSMSLAQGYLKAVFPKVDALMQEYRQKF